MDRLKIIVHGAAVRCSYLAIGILIGALARTILIAPHL